MLRLLATIALLDATYGLPVISVHSLGAPGTGVCDNMPAAAAECCQAAQDFKACETPACRATKFLAVATKCNA